MILALVGLCVGFLSGFFGFGGGTVMIPILLYLGMDMKEAVLISITQMVFSSISGSILEFRKKQLDTIEGSLLGFGGFIGGFSSVFFVKFTPEYVLQYMFLAVVTFALIRFWMAPLEASGVEKKSGALFLVIVGFISGLFAMSIGVGGAVVITPVLVGFMSYDVKRAKAIGLFFVVFSSTSGLISHLLLGDDISLGVLVGMFSLVGSLAGVKVAHITDRSKFKILLGSIYILSFVLTAYKIFAT